MLALAGYLQHAFGIGTGLAAMLFPVCWYATAGGMSAFCCRTHEVLLLLPYNLLPKILQYREGCRIRMLLLSKIVSEY